MHTVNTFSPELPNRSRLIEEALFVGQQTIRVRKIGVAGIVFVGWLWSDRLYACSVARSATVVRFK